MAVRIQIRRDTADNWVSANPTLRSGEIGIETDTLKFKVGNGTSAWNQITSYANVTPSSLTSSLSDYILAADQGTPGGPAELNSSGDLIIPENSIILWNDADYDYITTLTATQPTENRTITLPNNSGTMALTSDISTAISNLVDGAPGLLDTLNELAAAINDDPSFFTSVATNLSNHESDTTNIHGIADTSKLVTIDATQTLTNKTLTSPKVNENVAVTATATEINVLDGITASTTELNYVDGVTSAIQTQLDSKATSTDLTNHASDTTSIHGIADTAELATKTFAAELLTNSIKTNITITGDKNGLTISAENGVADSTTDNLVEGSTNKYFTDERAQDAIGNSLGTGLSYSDSTGAISVTANTYDAYGAAATVQTNLGAHELDTSAHGTTGDIVGTSDTQTLTNKTLTSPKINENVALTATATELNTLDGITASTSELNILDGATLSTTELNYVDGVTSAIQTQINDKAPINNPTFTGSVTLPGAPTSDLHAATKLYVDNVTAGINFHESVHAASVSSLAVIYDNGTNGVGATLTADTNRAFATLDGETVVLGERVLIKNQADAKQNGIYTLTTVGVAGTTPWVLTRATDADNNPTGEMKTGDFVFVQRGTVNASVGYINNSTASPIVIGTDNITYTEFSAGKTVVAGNGLTESTPGTLAIDTAITADISTAQTFTNKTLTSPNINEAVALTATSTELNTLDGITASTAELNILDGVTATASELNILDGVTASTSELNLLDGVTATTAELNYVDGVTSAIQTQLDGKVDESLFDTKGDILVASADNTPVKLAAGTNGYLLTANSSATNGIEWAAAPVSLPSQSGNSGKYLTTDGSGAFWSTLPINIITQVTIDDSSSSAILDQIPVTNFVSAEYILSITQEDALTQATKVRTSRILIQTDGTSVDLTEYGIVETNGAISGVSVSADVAQDLLTLANTARLLVSVSDATTNVARARIVRTLVTPWVDTAPDAPISVVGTSGDKEVSVSFVAPYDNGGDAITSYTVTSDPGNKTATGSSSPLVVTGLTNGTAYTFTVTATNSVGTSDASQASSSVTPSTVPDAPTINSATAGNTQIEVAFTAPTNNGGASISGYTATATPAVGSAVTVSGSSSPLTITGLTNGTEYTVSLVATNIKGNSSTATYGSGVTPVLPVTATGGVITTAGGYTYHTFTSTDNFILSNGSKTVDILCIAGGGGGANGGGSVHGGGGGAGGLQYFGSQTLTPSTYLVTVGSGGGGGAFSYQRGGNGTNSQFGSLTASVGGGGGGRDSYTGGGAQSAQNGRAGGSGGGGGGLYTTSSGGAGTAGQGNNGGAGQGGGLAGGGGGAGAAGSRPNGGAGLDYSAWASATSTGSSGFYAGGGGGANAGTGQAGGGTGGSGSGAGFNATANTGSGGGGGSQNGGNSGSGNGSNGLVIVRYSA